MIAGSSTQVTEDYARRLSRMRRLHEGQSMAEAASSVLHQLPDGPLCLLSTSTEGVALAAVVSSLRSDESTVWERLDFGRPRPIPSGHRVVVVEPEDGGPGWRSAIESKYPGATFVTGLRRPVALAG